MLVGAQKGKEFDVMKMMVTPVTIPPTSHTIPTSPSSSSLSVTSPSSPFPSISPSASSISPSSLSSLSLSIPFPSGDSEAPPPVKPAKAWEGLKKVETQYERTLYVCNFHFILYFTLYISLFFHCMLCLYIF